MKTLKEIFDKKNVKIKNIFYATCKSEAEKLRQLGARASKLGNHLIWVSLIVGAIWGLVEALSDDSLGNASDPISGIYFFVIALIFGPLAGGLVGLVIGLACMGIGYITEKIIFMRASAVLKKEWQPSSSEDSRLNLIETIDARLRHLDNLEKEICIFANQLEINFLLEKNIGRLQDEINKQELDEIYGNLEKLKEQVECMVSSAEKDSRRLKNYALLYDQTMSAYGDANIAAQISQNASCIDFSDKLLVIIENTKEYIPKRAWKDFEEKITKASEFIEILLENAKNVEENEGFATDSDELNQDVPIDDPYVILDILPWATDEEVKQAFQKQAKQYHPDKHSRDNEESHREHLNKRFGRVMEAYKMIKKERQGKAK